MAEERDWLAEARRLLNEATGVNDNGADSTYLRQRRTLLDRLDGYLVAQGRPVEAAFRSEVCRIYRRESLGALDDSQLAELFSRFDKMMRMARLLAATPAGRG